MSQKAALSHRIFYFAFLSSSVLYVLVWIWEPRMLRPFSATQVENRFKKASQSHHLQKSYLNLVFRFFQLNSCTRHFSCITVNSVSLHQNACCCRNSRMFFSFLKSPQLQFVSCELFGFRVNIPLQYL